MQGDTALMKSLVEAKANQAVQDPSGNTALSLADSEMARQAAADRQKAASEALGAVITASIEISVAVLTACLAK
jgi:hypothetical protein